MDTHLERAILRPMQVPAIGADVTALGGTVEELVSSGINDVYCLTSGHYLKVFNTAFVDCELLERAYVAIGLKQHARATFSLPVNKDPDSFRLGSTFIEGRKVRWAIYKQAPGSVIKQGDNAIIVKAAQAIADTLSHIDEAVLRPPKINFETVITAICAELTLWSRGRAAAQVSRTGTLLATIQGAAFDRYLDSFQIQHGDLHHNNIFSDGNTVTIIDLDFISLAPAGYDIATILWMQMRSQGLGIFAKECFERHELLGHARSRHPQLTSKPMSYWHLLLLLRHLFFLHLQVKLWRYRGSNYAFDRRTEVEIDTLSRLAVIAGKECA